MYCRNRRHSGYNKITMMITELILMLVCLPLVSSLKCLHCTEVSQPRHCRFVTECALGEVCGVETKKNHEGEDVYDVGCVHNMQCNVTGAGSLWNGFCRDCCTTDLCNAAGCSEPGYPQPRGRICYSCQLRREPNTCQSIEICPPGQVCKTSMVEEFGDKLYSSGCTSTLECDGFHFGGSVIVGRSLDAGDYVRQNSDGQCDRCCNSDLCNNCNTTNAQPVPDPCSTNPCHHGVCRSSADGFVCDCDTGYSGNKCQTATGPCHPNPCVHGQCYGDGNHYVCSCDAGLEGQNCSRKISPCLHNPCIHGTCTPENNNNNYTCMCEDGYTGRICDTATGPCLSNPCVHGRCYGNGNDYVCSCDSGFEGQNCSRKISPCLQNPCIHGQCTPVNNNNNYHCTCEHGYTGGICETEISPCLQNPCIHGKCTPVNNNHNYYCTCEHGYTGGICDTAYDGPCHLNPCVHGQCYGDGNHYVCLCDTGFEGKTCNTTVLTTDCYNIKKITNTTVDGVYSIKPPGWNMTRVYCDMTTDGGGWTVFQNRYDGSLGFYRNFSDYENGFGDLNKEFWLGLKIIRKLVENTRSELRLDLTAADDTHAYEVFQNFNIGASPNYILHVDQGHGTAGDSFARHNNLRFITYDRDDPHNCTGHDGGGWWYSDCAWANLNGHYGTPGIRYNGGEGGVTYLSFKQFDSLKTTKIMCRRS